MGSAINTGTTWMATDLAGALGGLLSLAVVFGGIVLVTGVGGQRVQEFLHRWLWQAVIGAILLDSFSAIASSITAHFKV